MNELAKRLLSRIKIDKTTKCWVWGGSLGSRNRARIIINGKNRLASRVSYEVFVGPLKKGDCVCHKCDNPACINPLHFFVGDMIDNINDMMKKNRMSQNSTVKISADDVIEIRKMLDHGVPSTVICEIFNLTRSRVSAIKLRATWRHI